MPDAVLVMNLRLQGTIWAGWDPMPQDVWRRLLKQLPAWGIDGFALGGVRSSRDLVLIWGDTLPKAFHRALAVLFLALSRRLTSASGTPGAPVSRALASWSSMRS